MAGASYRRGLLLLVFGIFSEYHTSQAQVTSTPTRVPTELPTRSPTMVPTNDPTLAPTTLPSRSPTNTTMEGDVSSNGLTKVPPEMTVKSVALVTLLGCLYILLIVLTLATPPKEQYNSALLSRVRQSRFFTEGMTYMAALSTRGTSKVAPTPRTWQRIWDFTPRVESSEGSTLSVAGSSGGSSASAFDRHGSIGQISELDHMARQALARFRVRMKVEGAEAMQRLVSERLGLIDHLAALNRPMVCGRGRCRGTRATAQVGIEEEVTNTPQDEYTSSGRLDISHNGSIGSDEEAKPSVLLTPAKLNLARLSERQKVFNVFLHALTLMYLTVTSTYGNVGGHLDVLKDYHSILAFVVFASRILAARVLTAFTASSLVRIVFNVINKDNRQAGVFELELLDADVPFVPLRSLPPAILDSTAQATLQVVMVELQLCKHALVDEMRHGTAHSVAKAAVNEFSNKQGASPSKGARGPNVVKMLHLTVPLSQPLSIIEALQIVQTQLQHAQDMQAKQHHWIRGDRIVNAAPHPCDICSTRLFSAGLMGNPLHLLSTTAKTSRTFDLWFPTRLGWSPLALVLRLFYVLFIARELPHAVMWLSKNHRMRLCQLLLVAYMTALTVHITCIALKARLISVLTDLAALGVTVFLAAMLWPLVIILRCALYGAMLSRLRESLVNQGLEFKDAWQQDQMNPVLESEEPVSTSASILDDATPRMSDDVAVDYGAFVAAGRHPRGRGQDDDVMAFSQGSVELENVPGEEGRQVGHEEEKSWHTPHSSFANGGRDNERLPDQKHERRRGKGRVAKVAPSLSDTDVPQKAPGARRARRSRERGREAQEQTTNLVLQEFSRYNQPQADGHHERQQDQSNDIPDADEDDEEEEEEEGEWTYDT